MTDHWGRRPPVEIGNPRGRIAIYFDETRAWDYHDSLHSSDGFRAEIAAAIREAYPPDEETEARDD